MSSGILRITTNRQRELINITGAVKKLVAATHWNSGVLYLFNPHTTAGLTINEGADPDVQSDIIRGLNHLVPENLGYRHREGNSPAHIMATLAGASLSVIVEDGSLLLGTWQQIFFCEFDGPRARTLHWKYQQDK